MNLECAGRSNSVHSRLTWKCRVNPYRPRKPSCQLLDDEISDMDFGFMPMFQSERTLVTVGEVVLISSSSSSFLKG